MGKSTRLTNIGARQLYKRVYSLIRRRSGSFFKLMKLRGVMGWCEWEDGIKIDYRKELVPTIIHECIHYLQPDWPESRVLYAEKRIVNVLKPKQIVSMLKAFLRNM